MSDSLHSIVQSAMFCDFPGCMALLPTPYTQADDLKAQAEAAGWEVDTALNRCLCPSHNGGAPVGAMVPSVPPRNNPGLELDHPADCGRVLVGV